MFRLILRCSDLSKSCLLANRVPASGQIAVVGYSGGSVGSPGKRSALRKFVYFIVGTGFISGSVVGYALYDPHFRQSLENLHPHVPLLFQRIESILPENTDIHGTFEKAKSSGRALLWRAKDEKSDAGSVSISKSAPGGKPAPAKRSKAPYMAITCLSSKSNVVAIEDALKLECEHLDASVAESISAKRQVVESCKKTTTLLQEAIAENRVCFLAWSVRIFKDLLQLAQQNPDLASSYAQLERNMKLENEREYLVQKDVKKMRALLNDSLETGLRSGVEAEVRKRFVLLTDELEKTDAEVKLISGAAFPERPIKLQMREAVSNTNVLKEYKEIAQAGVRRFKDELKSFFPHISFEGSPRESELIALSALLSARLDLKQKELEEMASVEMKRAEQVVDKQAEKLLDLSERRIQNAEEEIERSYSTKFENELNVANQRFENDLNRHLKQQAAAHAELLTESLKSQEERLEQLHKADIETRLYRQKEHLQERFGKLLTEIQEFAAAIVDSEEREMQNRRAKELWFTSREFRCGVLNGRAGKDMESRRKPLAKDIIHLRNKYGADPFVAALVDSIPDEAVYNGVYSEVDLKTRFKKLDRVCRKTVIMEEAGGGILGYWASLLWSMFMFDPRERVTANEEIDLNDSTDKLKILSKAKYCVAHDDFLTAVKLMNLLSGEPARLASAWIKDTIYFLETFQAAQLLVAHADATFKRTMY
ncbi:Mitochondrial inner membrane protein [Trichuris trichiura]|uniref:MICOS complex subunit MIC60 n=1 Tax=Trichuris trichiura TaxID=36087 RepID=A0A077Z6H7_TRITR|nr:Mitochondrial inner membrane protein [Trichuris trichiura]